MCCGGVGADTELIRINTVLNALNTNGVEVKRYNTSDSPQAFIKNAEINEFMDNEGVHALPVTVVDGKIVTAKAYPTNGEIVMWLNIPADYLVEKVDNSGACCKF